MVNRSYQPSYARRSRLPVYLFGGLASVLLLTGAVLATLLLLGVDINPFASVKKEDPYVVRIPVNAAPIPAYTRVDRSHLLDPKTGNLLFQKLPPATTVGMALTGVTAEGTQVSGRIEAVKREKDDVVFVVNGSDIAQSRVIELGGALMNVNAIIGRVVKKDKRAGLGFKDETFFPQGTPEGIAGATPPGMRAVTLDATKLTGVHSLNAGDEIDLFTNVPLNEATNEAIKIDEQTTEAKLLAQEAVVIKPVYVRSEASKSSSLTQGTMIQNVPKYEVAIAVKPEDVIPLQNALNRSLAITCVARSMKPEEASVTEVAADAEHVRVPVTVRAIHAYDTVAREAFVSVATRSIRMELIDRQEADRLGVITSLDDAIGAIAKHDIPAGHYVCKGDLLSGPPRTASPAKPASANRKKKAGEDLRTENGKLQLKKLGYVAMQDPADELEQAPSATAVGDRPAVSRFVPAGFTAYAFPWNRLFGSEHLQIGDNIDLMVSYSLERKRQVEEIEKRPDNTIITRRFDDLDSRKTDRTSADSLAFRAEPWFVATNAIVIGPVGFPAPAAAMRALRDPQATDDNGSNNRVKLTGPAILIAVEDRDAEIVASALATPDSLFSVAIHSSDTSEEVLADGLKRIVVVHEFMPAYAAFSESEWKGNRRRPVTRLVPADDPRYKDAIDAEQLTRYFGRALKRAKSRGDFLTEADFLPPGIGPGVAAGGRSGGSVVVVANDDIEGIDSFETEDRLAILSRRMTALDRPVVNLAPERPVCRVVAANVRVIRRSLNGQTTLEIPNEELSRFLAYSPSVVGPNFKDRSNLVAVAMPRSGELAEVMKLSDGTEVEIPSFDAYKGVEFMEVIIGRRRTTYGVIDK